MQPLIIETHELVCRFGSVTAVDALTLPIRAAEVLGLLGRNGTGKTTVIKMLSTLLPPSQGSATVGGSTSCGKRRRSDASSATSHKRCRLMAT